MSAFIVVNPHSAGGRTAREWSSIEMGLRGAYPKMTVAMTSARGEATALVRRALGEGYNEVVAVGGDGTINEAVNGFFDSDIPVAPDAVFGFVTSGTGGDFRKTFNVAQGYAAAIARLKEARPRPIDVGKLSCVSRKGEPVTRYFVNIASFGLSGVIVDAVNRARIAKLFGGQFAFAFHSALAMLSYRDRTVRIRVDLDYDEIASISTVAIANGLSFGGGMRVAPNARPDDGVFDVIVMGGAPKGQALKDMKLIYTGEHLNNPNVRALRGRKVMAAPVAETKHRPVLIEVDGESAGQLPATFEILPRALNLRC
ncbi:MAG: diacylglycerol kinase family lipid kinase [Proteobacteria bacterium]|nr:diacylglycerol kinase family lipid kinase [Pseudomonadota bacterium]